MILLLACTSSDGPIEPGVLPDSEVTHDSPTDSPADSPTDSPVESDPITRVYLLAGQSNMDGYGQTTSLPPSLRTAQPDAEIYWSGMPVWRGLQASSPVSGLCFGPEVLLGRTLADAYPEDDVRLIKHSVGGTNLAEYWYPGTSRTDPAMGDGYRIWIETVEAGLEALEADGDVEIAGMAWMQGESDAITSSTAVLYEDNLTRFIQRAREDVGTPDMPFVMGLIHCPEGCPAQDTVTDAMKAVAAADAHVTTVETEDLRKFPNDAWHYQGPGQRVLGTRMARSLLSYTEPPAVVPAIELIGTYTYSYYGDYTVGWRFTNDQPLTVTDLGLFDLGWDGLNHASEVVLWSTADASRTMSATVPATSAAPTVIIGGFRYAAIEPTVLPAGDWIITAQSFAATPDIYIYGAETAANGVEWVEGRHGSGSAQLYPTAVVASTPDAAQWFGANFLYEP
ncbi:MAG: sialate O-acetylesterase [Proteobacteria bacterium]|nr:sialate O-acetylesterase [Pseudomonadota bacterium]MCP4918705.1 sialate O-acetylesterase [Pseudomonadota bacterium]